MKILFVATVDIHIINHHLRTIHELAEMGHLVDVASNGDYTNNDINRKYNVRFSKSPTSVDNLRAYRDIKKIMTENNYDIISCHTPLSSFFTRLAAKNINTRVIYTAHGFHFYQGAPLINTTIYKTMEKIAAKYTDILVTINKEDYNAAKQFTLKKNGEVKYIPGVGIDCNGIRNEIIPKEEARKKINLSSDSFVLFSIGELNKNKNHLFVIRALEQEFKNNPQLHYVICGRDLWNGTYLKVINELNLTDQVHLLGYREDVKELLCGADLYLSPSYREGLPVSVLEAMVTGIPVIASDVRGNHDLIDTGIDGFLYESDNKEQFLDLFNTLYGNKQLRARTSAEGKTKAEQYDISKIDPLILSLYE